jgi:hypothetical protein
MIELHDKDRRRQVTLFPIGGISADAVDAIKATEPNAAASPRQASA